MQGFLRSRLSLALIGVVIVASVAIPVALSTITPKAAYAATANVAAQGNLDCNGDSSIQKPLRSYDICTDLRGLTW